MLSCRYCIHLLGKDKKKRATVCKAFNDGIPLSILSGEISHNKKLPIQNNNIVFVKLPSTKKEELISDIITSILEGSAGSGHWGHRGRKGQKGGSVSGFTAMPGERKDLQAEIKKRGLVIPPMYKNVKLNIDPEAGLQATGIDMKGREQPIYSAKHCVEADAEKFARLKEFTKAVPKLQKRIEADFDSNDGAKALYLISQTGFRVGSNKDTKAAVKAYGASTLEARHITMISESTVKFNFIGKKGVVNSATLTDKKLAKYCKDKKAGKVFDTTDSKIRRYLKKIDGEFKVKDYRTFIGTSEAIKAVNSLPTPKTGKERRAGIMLVCKQVAKKLGNTPAVARSAYIAPEVFDRWNYCDK